MAVHVLLWVAALSALAAARSYTSEVNNDMLYIKQCNETVPIPLDVLNTVLVHKKLTGEGDSKFKCFLHCLYTKYGWMDDEGSFLLGAMKKSLEDSELDELTAKWMVYKCTKGGSPQVCERAFRFTECFWEETRKFPETHEDMMDLYKIL